MNHRKEDTCCFNACRNSVRKMRATFSLKANNRKSNVHVPFEIILRHIGAASSCLGKAVFGEKQGTSPGSSVFFSSKTLKDEEESSDNMLFFWRSKRLAPLVLRSGVKTVI